MINALELEHKRVLSDVTFQNEFAQTFRVHTLEDVRLLGEAFGKAFVAEALNPTNRSDAMVCCAYGVSGAGKTEFFENAIRPYREKIGLDKLDLKVEKDIVTEIGGGNVFRHLDLGLYKGARTYTSFSGTKYFSVPPWSRWRLTRLYKFPPRSLMGARGGLDILEHASVKYYDGSDVVLFFSDATGNARNKLYLNNVKRMVNTYSSKNPQNEFISKRIDRMQCLTKLFERAKSINRRMQGPETPKETLVDVVLKNPTEANRQAFKNFMNAVPPRLILT